tara:strand:- start:109 stop:393 length:285 start_codon:yes stop_codon:yes gene_type:complete
MRIGLVYPYDEKKYQSDLDKGKTVSLGVDIDSLLDEINKLEIDHHSDTNRVVAEIKYACMVLLGKIQEKEQPIPEEVTEHGNEHHGNEANHKAG